MVNANWSGEYPNLCSGKWTLEVDGINVSDKIPEDLQHSPMGTCNQYQSWHFDEDYLEVFESYEDGLECDDWISQNKHWLDTITDNADTQQEIFHAINNCDWRHGSCGGCI